VLLLAEPHPEWGQILVALVRAKAGADADALIAALQKISQTWPAAERPRRWCNCPTLTTSSSGKWQRGQWRSWLAGLPG
jgi:O-succinylbenzoic acid--CoA ligase